MSHWPANDGSTSKPEPMQFVRAAGQVFRMAWASRSGTPKQPANGSPACAVRVGGLCLGRHCLRVSSATRRADASASCSFCSRDDDARNSRGRKWRSCVSGEEYRQKQLAQFDTSPYLRSRRRGNLKEPEFAREDESVNRVVAPASVRAFPAWYPCRGCGSCSNCDVLS